jgi:DNA-binding transcriptional LysR family regulator
MMPGFIQSVLLAAQTAFQTTMSITATELAALHEGTSGTIRLGAFVSAAASIVPPALARLRSSNPAVHVTLRQLETSDSYDALLRGDLDLAVTFDYDGAPQPAPDGITRQVIRIDPLLIVLPVAHPLASHQEVDAAGLAPDAWIRTPVDATQPGTALPAARPLMDGDRLGFEGDDFRTVISLVAAGLGVALLPQLALHDAPAGIVGRPVRGAAVSRRIYLARLDTRNTPAAVTALERYLASPGTP